MESVELELRVAFLEDADELLAEAEAAFLRLESGDDSDQTVGAIFRLAHSFKGSAAIVGFDDLAHVAHHLEDVLSLVRKKKLRADRGVCTVIFATLDTIKGFVESLKRDPDSRRDFTPHIEGLKNLLITSGAQEAPKLPAATPPPALPGLVAASKASEAETQAVAASPTAAPEKEKSEEQNIRVSTKRLDQLINVVGEMVVNQSILSEQDANGTPNSETSVQTRVYMDKLVKEAQRVAMSLRLIPVKPLFQKMRRAVRDVAVLLGKDVELVTLGEEAEIDKTILEEITDPLTHLIRNAVDHGIEPAEERTALGKPRKAIVTLEALQQEEQIILRVSDDGSGMDRERIVAKAIAKQLLRPGERLSDKDVYAMVFAPGFSTKDEVTAISGRGVGLDVVQKAVSDLKGTIDVASQLGKGTTFVLSLPLSLSIISGMVVAVDRRKYILPVTQLVETIEISKLKVETITGKCRIVNLRGEVIPILSLSKILHGLHPSSTASSPESRAYKPGLVILHHGKKVSFEVDEIVGQQQIVIKRLGNELRGLPGIVAGAILSTGEPGLVLDLQAFASKESTHAA